jgi:hypothetical protein
MLEDRDNDLRSMVYNPQQPIDVVFNAVEDYVDFADLGHQALSPQQTIGKACVVINKTRRFKNDITAWNRLLEIQKKTGPLSRTISDALTANSANQQTLR